MWNNKNWNIINDKLQLKKFKADYFKLLDINTAQNTMIGNAGVKLLVKIDLTYLDVLRIGRYLFIQVIVGLEVKE